jgi:malate dehydrogenase (oxaloacetate-decarboxylating)(NADP+)
MLRSKFRERFQIVRTQTSSRRYANGLIWPPQNQILAASLHVATKVAECIYDHGLSRVPHPGDVKAQVAAKTYKPIFPQ